MMERKCAECHELFHWTKTWAVRLTEMNYGIYVCADCLEYLETQGLIADFPDTAIHTPILERKPE